MFNIHQELLTRPTYVEIDLSAVRHNFKEVKKIIGDKKMLCIVKGNAYGHGSVEMAQVFERLGADYLGVAIPEEGVELRKSGIKIPILVLSAISDVQIEVCIDHDLTMAVPSDERISLINEVAKNKGKRAKAHIKIDTGMNRIGVHYSRVSKLFEKIKNSEHIYFEGIFSHFAKAGEEFTETQINRFKEALLEFKENGISFDIEHIANSGGIVFHKNSHFSMVRAGMILYGYLEGLEDRSDILLKKAMIWKTTVTYFKYIESGVGVGYDHTYISKNPTRIVTLPVGYADGYQRAMGKNGRVIIRDTLYPIAGKICMDQMMIDIGRNGESYKGDEVILVGNSDSCSLSFTDIASWSNTSIYEIMSQISYRVPRKYIDS